jgi:hypothetical protein
MTLTPGLILKTQFFNLFLLTYLLVSMPFTWHFLTSWNICFSLWWSKWRLCAAVTAKIQVINNMGEVVKFVSSSQLSIYGADQGCQVVYFQTKNPYLGKFWRALYLKMLIHFIALWNISRTFGIFYYRVFIWNIFSSLGLMYQDKSGNPGSTATWNCRMLARPYFTCWWWSSGTMDPASV